MDRNEEAKKDLKARTEAKKEPEGICENCGKKFADAIYIQKVGGKETRLCSKECVKEYKFLVSEQRRMRVERLEKQIICLNRDVVFKTEEINTGNILETLAVNQIPGQPACILEGFKDGLKPKHIIQNEIELRELEIKLKQEEIANIKKLEKSENAS